MSLFYMIRDEAAAVGLPMRMVVLTIIGMAGLAAMIIFISDMNIVPKSMHADITGIDSSNTSSVIYCNGSINNIIIKVIDVDSEPVEGATVVIYGLDTSASGLSDMDGYTSMRIDTSTINVAGEGYLKLSARATGFADYQNDFAIKVVGN